MCIVLGYSYQSYASSLKIQIRAHVSKVLDIVAVAAIIIF